MSAPTLAQIRRDVDPEVERLATWLEGIAQETDCDGLYEFDVVQRLWIADIANRLRGNPSPIRDQGGVTEGL